MAFEEIHKWLNSGTDMSFRQYIGLVLAKHEPGVTLADCTHEFSDMELEALVNIHPDLTSYSIDDRWIQTRYIWSPARVYVICDEDGRLGLQSAPRNPG
jgi:hypothetical protein